MMLCKMGSVVEAPIPKHITGIYVFAVVNLLAMLCISKVDADIIVKDLLSNETAARISDLQAKFGPDFPNNGLEGRLLVAEPDAQACGPIKPPPHGEEEYHWILLIARGGSCQFSDKVLNAQLNNYSAAIVYNSEGKDSKVPMAGGSNGSRVTIPSTFVGWSDGMDLKRLYDYYTHREYMIKIIEDESIDYSNYIWLSLLVMAICIFIVMIIMLIKFLRDYTAQRLSRLSNKHLKKIPVRKFKKGDYYDTCAICLEEYQEGEKIRVLPCDHVYHRKCIDPWLTKNKKTCPVCKRRVIPGRDADSESGSEDENTGTSSAVSENTPLLRGRSTQSHVTSRTETIVVNTQSNGEPTAVGSLENGAVGGAGISDKAHHHLSEEHNHSDSSRGNTIDAGSEWREARHERKRKRQDRSSRTWREDDAIQGRAEDEAIATTVCETKGRRERRKRRKDKKKGEKADRKQSHDTQDDRKQSRDTQDDRKQSHDTQDDRKQSHDTQDDRKQSHDTQDDRKKRSSKAMRDLRKSLIPDDDEKTDKQTRYEKNEEDGTYANPSFFESHEIVNPVVSNSRRQLNEVV